MFVFEVVMDISTVEISDKPMKLRDHISIEQIMTGNYEAMRDLILSRTGLTIGQTLDLDDEEVNTLLKQIYLKMQQGIFLQGIGRSLDERSDQS
jgi:hypothetical protein